MTPAQRLIYVANNRLPTERAHGLQIVQNCEALAAVGYAVTLVAPRRRHTAETPTAPLWDYYGVACNFTFRRLWSLDLLPWFPQSQIAFLTQTFTYLVALAVWLLPRKVEVIYTRDIFAAAVAAALRPRTRLAYEVHQVNNSRLGRALQAFVVRRAVVIPITAHLGEQMLARGADKTRLMIAHDGIRRERFETLPTRDKARAALGWPREAFVVGWVGRLAMLGMDKGVATLVDALSQVEGATLALVGGPAEAVAELRAQWVAAGQLPERFLAPGHVPPSEVPRCLAACDVCVLSHPWTEHFAYFTSPIKLFEYMATGRAIVASDLPGFAEVVTHEESALLVSPGDAVALAAAITRLRDDPALRQRLGTQARDLAMEHYTWDARARAIRDLLEGG